MATESTTDAVVQPQAEPSNPADWPFTYSRLSGLPGLLHIVALRLWSHLRLMLALLVGSHLLWPVIWPEDGAPIARYDFLVVAALAIDIGKHRVSGHK